MSSSSRAAAAAGPPENPWFDWGYVRDNSGDILAALQQHVTLTLQTVLLASVLAVPLALVARRWRRLEAPIVGLAGVLYTIPSLALFAVLAPFTGIAAHTVLIGLVVYALLVLVRNTIAGLDGVPEEVRDAARGMGYDARRMFWRVELPIALPTIMTGVRIATVSTVALVTVGVVVGYGGLGTLILRGFNNGFYRAEIMTASLLCVLLALGLDLVLAAATRALTPWARGRA
ncbi:MAG: ABC transporter permease [Actinomycetota bacterium]|nr:ABC transporter permease [Actinomycetota bacterium]